MLEGRCEKCDAFLVFAVSDEDDIESEDFLHNRVDEDGDETEDECDGHVEIVGSWSSDEPPAPVASAVCEARLVISVRVEMRPPREGETGWQVSANADAHEALAQAIDGRGADQDGDHGFGWIATSDQDEYEEYTEGDEKVHCRNVTLVIEETRLELGNIRKSPDVTPTK